MVLASYAIKRYGKVEEAAVLIAFLLGYFSDMNLSTLLARLLGLTVACVPEFENMSCCNRL